MDNLHILFLSKPSYIFFIFCLSESVSLVNLTEPESLSKDSSVGKTDDLVASSADVGVDTEDADDDSLLFALVLKS